MVWVELTPPEGDVWFCPWEFINMPYPMSVLTPLLSPTKTVPTLPFTSSWEGKEMRREGSIILTTQLSLPLLFSFLHKVSPNGFFNNMLCVLSNRISPFSSPGTEWCGFANERTAPWRWDLYSSAFLQAWQVRSKEKRENKADLAFCWVPRPWIPPAHYHLSSWWWWWWRRRILSESQESSENLLVCLSMRAVSPKGDWKPRNYMSLAKKTVIS